LPDLLEGAWKPHTQEENLATYNGRRGPDDGLIDWHQSAEEIHSLIRAASTPHPGAYTWYQGRKLIVWRAELEKHLPWRGAIGRVLHTEDQRGALIQSGDGLLWLSQVQFSDDADPRPAESVLKVGIKLGFVVQDEVAALRDRVADLEARLGKLEARGD
jgi:methionyl-tRNA formyltransferase